MLKRFISILLISTLIIFAFNIQLNAKDKITLKVGSAYPKGNEATVIVEKFAELITKYSNGDINAQLFIAGSIGGDADVINGMQGGTLDLGVTGLLPINQYAKQYGFLNFPYVLKDYEHFKRVWKSKLGDQARDVLLKNNLKVVGTYYRGARLITANKAINNVNDLKGIKMRVPQNPGWDKLFKEFGCTPVVVALPELFKSLQSGIAESSEGPASQLQSYRLNEVQKYLIMSNHLISVGIMCMSDTSYKKLSDADKKTVEKALADAIKFGDDFAMKSENEFVQKLIAAGMKSINPDKESFRAKAKPIVDQMFKTDWNITTIDEINKL